MIEKAYNRLDITHNGAVSAADIKSLYNPAYHPAVMEGRKTQDQVLQEFLETFQTNHFILKGQEKEFTVAKDEFMEYYANISPCIEEERYFETMMINVWNLSQTPKIESKKPAPAYKSGNESPDSPLSHKEEQKQLAAKDEEEEVVDKEEKKDEDNKSVSAWDTKSAYERHVAQLSGANVQIVGSSIKHKFGNIVSKDVPKYQSILLERFRSRLVLRSGKGVIGLERQFKLFDLSGTGSLDTEEFKKAVNDYKLDVDERDLSNIFKVFDKTGEGRINYGAFMTALIGLMSEFRLNLVAKAFDKIDENEDGLITFDEMKKIFSARFHPDFKSGKKTEEDVNNEFLNTFEMHHGLFSDRQKVGEDIITKEEFITYYNKISAAIESDSYFDAMISGTWRLGLSFNTDKQPYAGVANKVYQVDSKACWVTDHHKTLMPQSNSEEERSKVASRSGKKAPGVFSPEETQKKNVQETNKEVIKQVREKLQARGIRGIIGIRRKFAVNHNIKLNFV